MPNLAFGLCSFHAAMRTTTLCVGSAGVTEMREPISDRGGRPDVVFKNAPWSRVAPLACSVDVSHLTLIRCRTRSCIRDASSRDGLPQPLEKNRARGGDMASILPAAASMGWITRHLQRRCRRSRLGMCHSLGTGPDVAKSLCCVPSVDIATVYVGRLCAVEGRKRIIQ